MCPDALRCCDRGARRNPADATVRPCLLSRNHPSHRVGQSPPLPTLPRSAPGLVNCCNAALTLTNPGAPRRLPMPSRSPSVCQEKAWRQESVVGNSPRWACRPAYIAAIVYIREGGDFPRQTEASAPGNCWAAPNVYRYIHRTRAFHATASYHDEPWPLTYLAMTMRPESMEWR